MKRLHGLGASVYVDGLEFGSSALGGQLFEKEVGGAALSIRSRRATLYSDDLLQWLIGHLWDYRPVKGGGVASIVAFPAGVAELAYATHSKCVARKGLWVRIPPPAPRLIAFGSACDSVADMCGRYTLTNPDPRAIRLRFGLPEEEMIAQPPRFNIAPTSEVLAIRQISGSSSDQTRREVGLLRWGLVPSFADPRTFDRLLINARSETVATKPVFRGAFEGGRCLIVADGFYEWQKTDTGKRPHFFSLPDRELFAFAGISAQAEYEDGSVLTSCSLLTCDPSREVEPIHKRMPVILRPDDEASWLDPDTPLEDLLGLMQPLPALDVREVSEAVNSSRNEGPELLESPMNLF